MHPMLMYGQVYLSGSKLAPMQKVAQLVLAQGHKQCLSTAGQNT